MLSAITSGVTRQGGCVSRVTCCLVVVGAFLGSAGAWAADPAVEEARGAYLAGVKFIEAGDYAAAVKAFTDVLARYPRFEEAYYGRGLAYANSMQPALAIVDYTQAIKLNPKDKRYYVNRAAAYLHLESDDRARDAKEALRDCESALALDPDYYEAYFARALARDRLGELDKSLEDYSHLLEKFPGNPQNKETLANRGTVYNKLGQNDKELQDYNAALALDPTHHGARFNRGAAFMDLGEYDKAIADFTRLIELRPDDAPAYGQRGLAYMRMREYKKAMADIDKALALDPKSETARFNRALVLSKLGRDAESAEAFSKIIALKPSDGQAYLSRGEAYERTGQMQAAAKDLDQAVLLDPKNPWSWATRGLFRFRRGEYDETSEDLVKALELKPDQMYWQAFLFLARERAGKDGKAKLSAFRKSRQTEEWPLPVIDMLLGTTSVTDCLSAAKDANAEGDKEKKCEAFYFVGELHILAGDRKQAAEFFGKCIDTGLSGFIGYEGAKAELERLGK